MQLSRQFAITGGAGFAALAGVAGAITAVSWRAAHSLIHPKRLPLWRWPADLGLDHEDVCLQTSDGVGIAGWLIRGRSEAAVVLAHGQARNRSDLLGVARVLVDEGFTTLLIDHRACGESEGRIETFGVGESIDIIAAVEYLRQLEGIAPHRVGALGWSMGAAAVLLAAGRSAAIRAVVADSPFACLEQLVRENFQRLTQLPPFPFAPLLVRFAEWQSGISRRDARPVEAIRHIPPRPVLLIHGRDDSIIPVHHAEQLVEAAGGQVMAWFPEGVDHVGASEADSAEYAERVVGFFDAALRR